MNNIADQYKNKIKQFIIPEIINISDPKIIEFGVRFGASTKLFIEICEKKNGELFSVDIDDCSNVSNSTKWKFIKSRDDNFNYLDKILPSEVDLIYLDSFHNADHIEKIFYHYYKNLKIGGFFIFDDISWLPYLKSKQRNNFNCEINNYETFNRILEILNANDDCIEVQFSFVGSGLSKIKKINSNNIKSPKKLKTRLFSLKNFVRKIIQ